MYCMKEVPWCIVFVCLFNIALVKCSEVVFKNQCNHTIDVYDNKRICQLHSGTRQNPSHGCKKKYNKWTGMFRHGLSDEATLAEFNFNEQGKDWYDISIIPPGCPGSCASLECCKISSLKTTINQLGMYVNNTGFNVGMMILPNTNEHAEGYRCEKVMCQYDGCAYDPPSSAYHYPSDNRNVYSCPKNTKFTVVFCP